MTAAKPTRTRSRAHSGTGDPISRTSAGFTQSYNRVHQGADGPDMSESVAKRASVAPTGRGWTCQCYSDILYQDGAPLRARMTHRARHLSARRSLALAKARMYPPDKHTAAIRAERAIGRG